MILLDVSHTCHTSSQSGIQQVCRNLYAELSKYEQIVPIVYDPFARRFRELDAKEHELLKLSKKTPSTKSRSSKWSWKQKIRGYALRWKSNRYFADHDEIKALIAPEILSSNIPIEAYQELQSKVGCKLLAIFHDAIALRMPKITPQKTVEYFPEYLSKLAKFDAVAAVSNSSKDELHHFWSEFKIFETPPVCAIPLGVSQPVAAPNSTLIDSNTSDFEHKILFVGSIEGRKNHLEALKAAENLWKQNHRFTLTLIGGAVPETASDALALLDKLIADARPIRWLGPVDKDTLLNAYQECTFTLYPSLLEGFGLPPLESISHGKPCLCTDRGGLAETATGGGCLIAKGTSADEIESALRNILQNQELYNQLAVQAKNRNVRTWNQYSSKIHQWFVKC